MGFPPFHDDFVSATLNTEKAKVFDQQMQATSVAMGTLDESQVSGIVARALASIKKQNNPEEKDSKQLARDLLYQALLDYIDDLQQDINDMEAAFQVEFGDAWREELALKILGENDIPQQRENESIEKYRERLETHLVEALINDGGSIKEEFKDDPELEKYAQWAQKIYNRDAAQAVANDLKNPATTSEQAQELLGRLEKAKNAEQNNYAADALEGHEKKQEAVLDVSDRTSDQGTLEERSDQAANDFMTPR